MKKVLETALFLFILCVVLAGLIAVVGFYFYPPLGDEIRPRLKAAYKSMPVRVSCWIPIPPEDGTMVFLRHGVHPSVTEYEYKLKMTKGSTTVERLMPFGNSTSILVNVYWYPANPKGGPWVRIQDQGGEVLVNMDKLRVFRLLHLKGRAFAGELSSGQEGTAMIESEGRLLVSVGRTEAQDITGLPVADSPGTYLGRVEGNIYRLKFVTPDQSPEKRIRAVE